MKQCKTQAGCFEELARILRMVEDTKIPWGNCLREQGHSHWPHTYFPSFLHPDSWKFAVALVEGKPVFIGDTIFNKEGYKLTIAAYENGCFFGELPAMIRIADAHWNPPKPKITIPPDYIPHNGGMCPVHPDTIVRVYSEFGPGVDKYTAKNVLWTNIIAYKIIKEAEITITIPRSIAVIYTLVPYSKKPIEILQKACKKALNQHENL